YVDVLRIRDVDHHLGRIVSLRREGPSLRTDDLGGVLSELALRRRLVHAVANGLADDQLGLVALGHLGRPANRAGRCLRAVRSDEYAACRRDSASRRSSSAPCLGY